MMRKHKKNRRGVLITAWKEKEAEDNNVSVAPLSHGHVTLIQNEGGANEKNCTSFLHVSVNKK